MENIEHYLAEIDREEFRISHSFSSSANGSSVSSTSSHKEIVVHRVTKSKTNSNLTSSPHQTTLNDNNHTMTASQIDPESTNVEHHQLADSFAAQAKQRLLRTIDNVVERQQLQFADENNENKCPNRIYRRSPIKKHQQFQKACDDPAMKNFKSTVEKFANDIMQKDELIEKLKNENSLLVRQNDHEMDASLALNIASTEHNYYLFEIDRLKKIINDEVSENEALKKKVEQLKKSLSEMSKEHERFEEQKRTIFGQIEALKIDNKKLSDENYLLKIDCLNMTQQMQILEAQNVEQLLNDNAAFKDENTALMRQIEMLQMEINKGSKEFEAKFSTLKKSSDEEIAKLKSRMSENETKYSKLIKDYDTVLTQCQSDIERLNKERSSFLKNLTSLQEEREKAREDLKSCRDSYEHRLTELSAELDTYKKSLASMNELSVDQQKRIERFFSDFEEKKTQSEKLLRSKEEELKRVKQAQQRSEEQIKFNEIKHAKDVDEIKKKAKKDIDEWRFKYEQTASNNAELSRANGEMRRRLQTIEGDVKELAEKNMALKHNLETAKRQKREMKEEMERNAMIMKQEIDTLLQLQQESNRKIGAHQAAMNRLQQQLDERQKELISLSERNRALELKCRVGDTYKAKYNDIKTYLRRGLYESGQMSINNNDSGRAQFFNKMIKELRIESNELDPNSS